MTRRLSLLWILLLLGGSAVETRAQSHWADSVLNTLSLDQQIGQLFMVAAYSNKDSLYEQQLEEQIRQYHLGGLIFFQGTPERQLELTNRYQQAAGAVPLMIGMDAEGGVGWRLKSAMEFPNQTLLGAIRDDAWLFQVGKTIGKHCRAMGVHVNFAPVVDVNNNPKNPVIGTRSFGERTDNVSQKAICYMQGLLDEQVMAVAKHFPGHGDTDTDSHLALPLLRHSLHRMDSVELAPFRAVFAAGIPGVLTAHLEIPAYAKQLPASLSPRVVTTLLREEMGFQGLCFTDAMNMKGVTRGGKRGTADVAALLAGNDVILFPEDIHASVREIKQALRNGELTERLIAERCLRILQAKERFVVPFAGPLCAEGLSDRLAEPVDLAVRDACYAQAITLVRNEGLILPLMRLDTLRLASLNFGKRPAEAFTGMLDQYSAFDHFALGTDEGAAATEALVRRLADYNCVVIYNSAARNGSGSQFGYAPALERLVRRLRGKRVILCHPATPYGLERYIQLPLDGVLIGYSADEPAQRYLAQALFGGIPVNGRLPVRIHTDYPAGFGLHTPKIRLGYLCPEGVGMRSAVLDSIAAICLEAIRSEATPGCEVLVARDGYVVYHQAFGKHTYRGNTGNRPGDIYDVASVTKAVATLPALMMLYDRGAIDLDTPASLYWEPLRATDKADITIRELLLHMGGLKPAFAFLQYAIDRREIPGRLTSTRRTATHTRKLSDNLYILPRFHYRDSTFAFEKGEHYRLVSPHFYIHEHFQDSIYPLLLGSERLPKKEYAYSDLGFILLKEVVEALSGAPMDALLKRELYHPLGAWNTDFLAHRTLDMDRVVPAADDPVYRRSLLHGYVHDPTAALLGGVAGHAGLFSTAIDLAKVMTLYLNDGRYGGTHFIDSATIARFTRTQMQTDKNRRGLGFDKPELRDGKSSPACCQASPCSYGHSGFTGTLVWNDPKYRLTYIFLSNRTFPNEFNNKLIRDNVRTRVQEVVYRSLPQTDTVQYGNNSLFKPINWHLSAGYLGKKDNFTGVFRNYTM